MYEQTYIFRCKYTTIFIFLIKIFFGHKKSLTATAIRRLRGCKNKIHHTSHQTDSNSKNFAHWGCLLFLLASCTSHYPYRYNYSNYTYSIVRVFFEKKSIKIRKIEKGVLNWAFSRTHSIRHDVHLRFYRCNIKHNV